VFARLAVLAAMGDAGRRAEPAAVEPGLRQYREVRRVVAPATLEGGDVLRVGRTLLVGLSRRTNAAKKKASRRTNAPKKKASKKKAATTLKPRRKS